MIGFARNYDHVSAGTILSRVKFFATEIVANRYHSGIAPIIYVLTIQLSLRYLMTGLFALLLIIIPANKIFTVAGMPVVNPWMMSC